MSHDQLAALVDQPNPEFDKFYADMEHNIPALQGRGAVEIQPAKFKKLLKIAYLAGGHDQLAKLLNSPDV